MAMKLIKRGLAALGLASLAIAPTAAAEARTPRGPALWQVSDKDTTIYLFGTIHLLPRESRWRTPKLDQAMAKSQSLILETLIDTANPQQFAGTIGALGFSSGLPPLASRVEASKRPQLEAAIAKLRQGVTNLNREGRGRLLEAFAQVNANFSALFTRLFGGGEASLVLVESDDPLEAGLEIMCQPPGKKLSTLSLLSGGEQTLTALSLIFAVFLANPSPICVLDEVDAPLDDANIERFCDLLEQMSRETDTRYLIVTHNAVTMSRMHRLFGVTMVERGVSRLVSVDLQAAELLAAE